MGIPRGKDGHNENQETRRLNLQLRGLFKDYTRSKATKDPHLRLATINKMISIYLQYDHLELEFMAEFSDTSYFAQCENCIKKYHQLSINSSDKLHRIK